MTSFIKFLPLHLFILLSILVALFVQADEFEGEEWQETPMTQQEFEKMYTAIDRQFDKTVTPESRAIARLEAFAYRTKLQLTYGIEDTLGSMLFDNDRKLILMTLDGAIDLIAEHPNATAEQIDMLTDDVISAINSLIAKVYQVEHFQQGEYVEERVENDENEE
jgi:hypothetical protein